MHPRELRRLILFHSQVIAPLGYNSVSFLTRRCLGFIVMENFLLPPATMRCNLIRNGKLTQNYGY